MIRFPYPTAPRLQHFDAYSLPLRPPNTDEEVSTGEPVSVFCDQCLDPQAKRSLSGSV
jgi:hypothetical protein